jgi:hypothetical protein
MDRIPFDGSIDGIESCPQCGALKGERHFIGCMGEECPKCGNLLVTCTCRIFVAEDKALAVRRLYNAINNPIAAWVFAAQFSQKSYLGLASWLWACLHSDPELIFSMVRTESGVLANLHASFCDSKGTPYPTVSDIARALGCGRREVKALEATFVGVEIRNNAEPLHRLH